jgi:hypothetical protein
MGRVMTRPWGQLHASTLTHRKYLQSNHEERSAWLTLILFSFANPHDDDLGSRADVEATLKTLGAHRRPAVVLDRLMAIGWLDLREDHYWLHDWEEWQPEDPTGAKRKAAQRIRDWGLPVEGHVNVTGQSPDSPGPGEERRGEENKERRVDAPETGPDVWYWVTIRYPDKRANPGLWDWLTRLADDFGVVRLWEVMRIEYARDKNKGTLLSRTEAILSRDADRSDREKKAGRNGTGPKLCRKCNVAIEGTNIVALGEGRYEHGECPAPK